MLLLLLEDSSNGRVDGLGTRRRGRRCAAPPGTELGFHLLEGEWLMLLLLRLLRLGLGSHGEHLSFNLLEGEGGWSLLLLLLLLLLLRRLEGVLLWLLRCNT